MALTVVLCVRPTPEAGGSIHVLCSCFVGKKKKVLSVEYEFSLCFSQFSDFWQHQSSDTTNEMLSEHKDAGSFSLF